MAESRSSTEATIVSLFLDSVSAQGDNTAVWIKRDGQFQATSWNQLAADATNMAAHLSRLAAPGDRIVQLSENRYEWLVCDLAVQLARAIHVPIHAPLTADQVGLQIADCGARVVLVSTAEQADKLAACGGLPADVQVFSYEPCRAKIAGRAIRPLAELLADAGEDAQRAAAAARAAITPDSLATILYTSGTTGEPKGVVLNQRNLVSNTEGMIEAIGAEALDVRLTFLPLSHVFARTCDMYTWIARGAQLALAEARETVIADCAAMHPTVMNGVPYFFDKVRRVLIDQGKADQPGALRELLGGSIRFCCSGGAALPVHVFDFFTSQEVPLLQGYGLTETSPVITVSSPDQVRRGASGRPIAGVEVKIAPDGEILTRGPHVMVGYYQRPEATAEIIRDGWLHTGDLGYQDDDGFLYITGRKKEIIVTSGGKNVAPVQLEALLTEDPLILQAVVVGDDRDYLTALIVPDPDALREEIKQRHIKVTSRDAALAHPQVLELYEQRIAERLASLSYYEQVRKFTLMNRGFTIESGELTPKLSLRRSVIQENCREQIEAMYRK